MNLDGLERQAQGFRGSSEPANNGMPGHAGHRESNEGLTDHSTLDLYGTRVPAVFCPTAGKDVKSLSGAAEGAPVLRARSGARMGRRGNVVSPLLVGCARL
jgi:hypothetical protein